MWQYYTLITGVGLFESSSFSYSSFFHICTDLHKFLLSCQPLCCTLISLDRATGSPTVDKKKITDTIPLQDRGIRLVSYNEPYLVL